MSHCPCPQNPLARCSRFDAQSNDSRKAQVMLRRVVFAVGLVAAAPVAVAFQAVSRRSQMRTSYMHAPQTTIPQYTVPQISTTGVINRSTTTRIASSINSDWTPLQSWNFAGLRYRPKKAISGAATTMARSRRASNGSLMPDGGLSPCIIKVVGVGGGGCNAVDRMLDTVPTSVGIDFWSLNTDAQVLGRSKAKGASVLNIGSSVTRGLGAGGNPEAGRMAAEESRKEIKSIVEGADLCFITAGMGGGTGSGAAPVVAKVAQECGCLTVGIVTKPFAFEGKRRLNQAQEAIDQMRQHVDTIIIVSNDRLLEIIPDDTPMERAFAVADDILRQGVVGIADIIVNPGLINVDFADVKAIMKDSGTALIGIGIGSGQNAAEDAAMAAMSSPLLDASIDNAKGIVFNISGGPNLTLNEVNKAAKLIYSFIAPDANVIFGALVDDSGMLEDNISITVLATGFALDDEPNSGYLTGKGTSPGTDSSGSAKSMGTSTEPPTTSSDSELPPFLQRS